MARVETDHPAIPVRRVPELQEATHITPLPSRGEERVAAVLPNHTVTLWDGESLQTVHQFGYPVKALTVCDDDRNHLRLIAIADEGAEAMVWNLSGQFEAQTLVRAGDVAVGQAVWPKEIVLTDRGFDLLGRTASAHFVWKHGEATKRDFSLRTEGDGSTVKSATKR
jgi:hypothetical protein